MATTSSTPNLRLWKHQEEALLAIRRGFKTHARVQLYTVSGGGKTTTFIALASGYRRVCILVPTRDLIRKTLKDLHRVWPESRKIPTLAACAKGTVNYDPEEDALACRETTSPDVIREHMAGKGKRIVLTTYMSSPHVRDANVDFDLAVFDEAHRCAQVYENTETRTTAALLHDTKTRIRKRLFVTASPRTYKATIRANALEAGHIVTSMDDKSKFGPVVYDFDYNAALNGGENVVKPFVVHVVHWVIPPEDDWNEARHMAGVAGLKRIREEGHDASHVIAFANKIYNSRRCKIIAQNVLGEGFYEEVNSLHHPFSARELVLDILKDEPTGIVFNVNVFTEGVDVPRVDCVMFVDPAHSEVAIIQAAGRAMRFDPDKPDAVAHIIVPMIHDSEGRYTRRSMEHVQSVLGALGEMDATFKSEITSVGRRSAQERIASHDLTEGAIPDFEVADVMRRIKVLTYSGGDYEWWRMCNRLRSLASAGGYPPSPGSREHTWIKTQKSRIRYPNSRAGWRPLTKDQIAALESLPQWSWESRRRPRGTPCSVAGCDRPARAGGLCSAHAERARLGKSLELPVKHKPHRGRSACLVDKCERFVCALGLCEKHYRRFQKYGDPLVDIKPGGRPSETLRAARDAKRKAPA